MFSVQLCQSLAHAPIPCLRSPPHRHTLTVCLPACLSPALRSTVSEISVNMLGLVIAGISVITSGLQQIMCGVIQRKHSMTSNQLLSNTAPVQVGADVAVERRLAGGSLGLHISHSSERFCLDQLHAHHIRLPRLSLHHRGALECHSSSADRLPPCAHAAR